MNKLLIAKVMKCWLMFLGQVLIRSDVIKEEARTHSLYRRDEQRLLGDNRILKLNDPTLSTTKLLSDQRGPAAAKPNCCVPKIAAVRGRLQPPACRR